MIYHSQVCALSGYQLKTDLQGLIGPPLGFCLFGTVGHRYSTWKLGRSQPRKVRAKSQRELDTISGVL